jgi:molybdopterin converting factor small subunit
LRDRERELKKSRETVEQYGVRLREEKERVEELQFKSQEQSYVIVGLNKEIEGWKEELRTEQEKQLES